MIRSARRLTYKEAFAISCKSRLHDELSRASRTPPGNLASHPAPPAFRQGSLDLDFPEVKVVVDRKTGRPLRLERIENDESHQLVEEFMLAANEAVALELKNRLIPTVYRVHENPDPDKLAEYRELVLSYGFQAGDLTNRRELQRLLASFRGKPEEQALKIGLLEEPEARALRHPAARPFRSGEKQLHPFHQSDPALRRSRRASHPGRSRRQKRRASWRRGTGRCRRAHLCHRAGRGRCRERVGQTEEARVPPAPAHAKKIRRSSAPWSSKCATTACSSSYRKCS